jgi:hypothetical protein
VRHHGHCLFPEAVQLVGPGTFCHALDQESDHIIVLENQHANLSFVLKVIPSERVAEFSLGHPFANLSSVLDICLLIFFKVASVVENGAGEFGPDGRILPVVLTVRHGCRQRGGPAGISRRRGHSCCVGRVGGPLHTCRW